MNLERAAPGLAALALAVVLSSPWSFGCSTAPVHDPDGGTPQRLSAWECLTSALCQQRLVAAHRGYHLQHPENSLAALRAAAELGADLVEVDPRHTADEVLVLMHDGSVDRTTNGQGEVSSLTYDQIRALLLDGGDPADPESTQVPRFDDALALAQELGVMLYVDQKTDRADLVLAAVQAGSYHRVALVRDNWSTLETMLAQDAGLLVMPPISTSIDFEYIRGRCPDLRIVEYAESQPSPAMTAAIHATGIRVQQDVMAHGDVPVLVGDYTGWKDFIEAGVDVLQTDFPHLLIPAVRQYEQTGVFPDQGPPAL